MSVIAYILGYDTKADGLGGIFYWDQSSTGVVDINTIQVTGVSTGRWIRSNAKLLTYPHGTMFIGPGKLKQFFYSGNTGANGQVQFFLTDNNTQAGNPLFDSPPLMINAQTTSAVSGNTDVTNGKGSYNGTTRQITARFTQPALGVLGILSVSSVATGVSVTVQVVGQ